MTCAAVATLLGVVFAQPALIAGRPWQAALLRSLIDWWSWVLVLPLILYVDRRLPFASRQIGARLLAHAALSVPITIFYLYIHTVFAALAGRTGWHALAGAEILRTAWNGTFIWVWPIYWPIAGGIIAMRYYREYLEGQLHVERLERLAADARLQALRLQLDPHFLFNALNTISAQTESQPRLARRMIGHLGDLLRSSLDNRDRHRIPLTEELAQLEHYLSIQRIRFGDRLTFATNIADDVQGAAVPALILQPIVENSIRHGIAPRAAPGRVDIIARREGAELVLVVNDDGVGIDAMATGESNGMGLAISRQRIAALYGSSGRFAVESRPSGGTQVEIRLPFMLDTAT